MAERPRTNRRNNRSTSASAPVHVRQAQICVPVVYPIGGLQYAQQVPSASAAGRQGNFGAVPVGPPNQFPPGRNLPQHVSFILQALLKQ